MRYQPHADLLNEFFRKPGQTHGAGSRCWHIVRMRYCFYIGLYQALLIDGGRWRKERKHVLISCVWGLVCLKTLSFNHIRKSTMMSRYLMANSELLASAGNKEILQGILTSLVVYTQLGETTLSSHGQRFNIKRKFSPTSKFVWNYSILLQSGRNLAA